MLYILHWMAIGKKRIDYPIQTVYNVWKKFWNSSHVNTASSIGFPTKKTRKYRQRHSQQMEKMSIETKWEEFSSVNSNFKCGYQSLCIFHKYFYILLCSIQNYRKKNVVKNETTTTTAKYIK